VPVRLPRRLRCLRCYRRCVLTWAARARCAAPRAPHCASSQSPQVAALLEAKLREVTRAMRGDEAAKRDAFEARLADERRRTVALARRVQARVLRRVCRCSVFKHGRRAARCALRRARPRCAARDGAAACCAMARNASTAGRSAACGLSRAPLPFLV
jgi:hypothetical protein